LKTLETLRKIEETLRTLGVSFSANSTFEALVLAYLETKDYSLLRNIYAWRSGRSLKLDNLRDGWNRTILRGIVKGFKTEEVIPSLLSRIEASIEKELVKIEELEDKLNTVIVLTSFSPVIALLFGFLSLNIKMYFPFTLFLTFMFTIFLMKILLGVGFSILIKNIFIYLIAGFLSLFLLLNWDYTVTLIPVLILILVIYVKTPSKTTLSELLNYYEETLENACKKLENSNLIEALSSVASIKGCEDNIALKTLYMLRNGKTPRIQRNFVTRFIYTTAKRSSRYAALASRSLLKITRDFRRIVAKYESKINAIRLRLAVTFYALESSLGVLSALALNPLNATALGAVYISSYLTITSIIVERKDTYRQLAASIIIYLVTYTLTRKIIQVLIL